MAVVLLSEKAERLSSTIAEMESVLVAFSGGADSALVAAVAARTVGDRALAVTAVSASLPPGELETARATARTIGIEHRTVRTHEVQMEAYQANGLDRCYHCKTELYDVLGDLARQEGFAHVVSGANADDLGDFRPGLRAAAERAIRHPLVEAGLGKDDVRELSRELGLPTWDKPASACLSSRFAFGVRIGVEELSKVGRAERAIKELGFRQVRVRVHDDVARVEVEPQDITRLVEHRNAVTIALKDLGYRFVTIDLEGFRSGSMNPPDGT
ncbi:MAG: ATP-dependent sacrificial sulfur transferase LarE [Actinomycetota bacterium]